MNSITSKHLQLLDRCIDYVPFVSTLTNLGSLFYKNVFIPLDIQNHYLRDKSNTRCVLLLVPVIGNGIILATDFMNAQKDDVYERIRVAEERESTFLDLSSLELTELPPEIGRLTRLIELDLSNNYLTCLPTEIGNLTSLTKLDLSED